MNSSWETSKQNSKYHFDNFKNNNEMDKVIKMGKIVADFKSEVATIIDNAKPATWRTRGEV